MKKEQLHTCVLLEVHAVIAQNEIVIVTSHQGSLLVVSRKLNYLSYLFSHPLQQNQLNHNTILIPLYILNSLRNRSREKY